MILVALQNAGVKAQLRVGFYNSTCEEVERIVKSAMEAEFKAAPTFAAGTLRLFFHDCFVNVLVQLQLLIVPRHANSTRQYNEHFIHVYTVFSVVISYVAGLRWLGAPSIHR